MRRFTFVNTVAAGGLLFSLLPIIALAAASDVSLTPSFARGAVEQQKIMSTPAVIQTLKPIPVPEATTSPVDKISLPPYGIFPLPITTTKSIIDDGDKGFSLTGQWQHFPLAGYNNDFLYATAHNGKGNISTAAWNFSGLKTVSYDVYVTWEAYAGLTDSAVYNISGISNASAIMNQRNAPADLQLENRRWKKIGTMKPNTKGQLKVSLASNVPSGFVIADAALLIPQKTTPITPKLSVWEENIASFDTAVSSQKNVQLLLFDARSSLEDILMTSAAFKASEGNANNAQNYALWVDSDNNGSVDTILQSNVAAQSGIISFKNIIGGGYVIPKDKTVSFEVRGDIASSWISNTLKLAFADGGVVSAKALNDGRSADVTISRTGGSTLYTIRTSGDLYITKSSTPVRSRQLLGGTLADEILRLQFHAEYEPVDVTLLRFSSPLDHSSVSVDRLELYLVGATTPFASATTAACGTGFASGTFCVSMQNRQLLLPKGSKTSVLVRPRMKTDTNGSFSSEVVNISLYSAIPDATVEARGDFSSNNLLSNDNDNIPEGEIFIGRDYAGSSLNIYGLTNVVVLSKVLSITNANPDANGTAIPTGAQRAIGQFKFSAAAANNTKNGQNKWTLSDIIFNVNVTNVATNSGSYKIYNKSDSSTKAPCTVTLLSSTQLLATCQNLTASNVNTQVDQGADTTFVLEAEVTNAKISNSASSTLQVSLQNFESINNTTFGASSSHLRWLDQDFGGSTPFLWIEYPETTINSTSYAG